MQAVDFVMVKPLSSLNLLPPIVSVEAEKRLPLASWVWRFLSAQ